MGKHSNTMVKNFNAAEGNRVVKIVNALGIALLDQIARMKSGDPMLFVPDGSLNMLL